MVQSRPADPVQNIVQQFQAQGIAIDQWLPATGQDRRRSSRARAGSRSRPSRSTSPCAPSRTPRSIEVADDDLDAEYARIAMQVRQKARDIVRKAYEQNDAVPT